MEQRRRYQQRVRAQRAAATRQRITDATLELHQGVGPAATRISDVARRAGVQRVTVYNHFPTDGELFAACSAHWRALHPTPDLDQLVSVPEPSGRLRLGLQRIYEWYRETEPMTANVLRDRKLLPALDAVIEAGLLAYLARAAEVLAEPLRNAARDPHTVDLAVRAVLDFYFWRSLRELGDGRAAALAGRMVEASLG
jgi:AcrR family transcriptional regulator